MGSELNCLLSHQCITSAKAFCAQTTITENRPWPISGKWWGQKKVLLRQPVVIIIALLHTKLSLNALVDGRIYVKQNILLRKITSKDTEKLLDCKNSSAKDTLQEKLADEGEYSSSSYPKNPVMSKKVLDRHLEMQPPGQWESAIGKWEHESDKSPSCPQSCLLWNCTLYYLFLQRWSQITVTF